MVEEDSDVEGADTWRQAIVVRPRQDTRRRSDVASKLAKTGTLPVSKTPRCEAWSGYGEKAVSERGEDTSVELWSEADVVVHIVSQCPCQGR